MSLDEKARRLAEEKKVSASVDWKAEKQWWLDRLQALYTDITRWMQPLVTGGLVRLERIPVSLSEERIGAYETEQLVLDFSGQAVILDPQGTLLMGARGRVDVFRRGRRASQPVMLILGRDKEAAVWEVWPTRDPRGRKVLDEQVFKDLVDSLL